MKTMVLSFLLSLSGLSSMAQLQGSFNYAQDGHVYFYLSNPTGYQIPVVWGVYNMEKNQFRQTQGVMPPYSTFTFGPNFNWIWEKGEQFAVTYANGQTVLWTCPVTEQTIRSSPSFKGASRGSCNIPSHRCGGFVDRNGDNYCDNCQNASCHAVRHQPN